MINDDQAHWNIADSSPTHRGIRWAGWPLMLFLAWLLFELTADTALAAVVACARFGWSDFQTALWLRRTDPQKGRGKTCFWFYLASALWKVAVTASVLMFLFPFIMLVQAAPNQPRANAPPAEFTAALVQAMLGFLLASMATAVGAACALRRHVKVWVDGAVYVARRDGFWPPSAVCRANRTGVLLTTTLIVAAVPCFVLLFIVQIALVGEPGHVNKQHALWTTVFLLVSMLLAAVLILGLREWLTRRVVAAVPWECWPPDEPEVSMHRLSHQAQ